MGKVFISYETDRRKIQKKSEILTCPIPAVDRTGSPLFRFIRVAGDYLRVVGNGGGLLAPHDGVSARL